MTKTSYGCMLPCSVFIRYTLSSVRPQLGWPKLCEHSKQRLDKGMGVSAYALQYGGSVRGSRNLRSIFRFGNRSGTLVCCLAVQPLRVYRMGYLLATALCSNFACVCTGEVRSTEVSEGKLRDALSVVE